MWLPLERPLLASWLTTWACALTEYRTSDPLVHRRVLNPLSHTSQGISNRLLGVAAGPQSSLLIGGGLDERVVLTAVVGLCHSAQCILVPEAWEASNDQEVGHDTLAHTLELGHLATCRCKETSNVSEGHVSVNSGEMLRRTRG